MEQSTLTYPNIVQSLDKLKILLFWEILKTKNPLLLDVDYVEDKQYSEEEAGYIVQRWEILYDSYFQMKNDGKSKQVLQKSYDVLILSQRIKILNDLLNLLEWIQGVKDALPADVAIGQEQTVYRRLIDLEPDLNLKVLEPAEINAKIVTRRIDALQNKHNRLKEDNEKEVEKQVDNVFSVIAKVSKITQMQLNAHNMVVTEWLAYEEVARETIKAEKEAADKRRRKK